MARQPDPEHTRPPGVSDTTVRAVGKVDEAFERIERARGHLYDLHQLIGRAHDLLAEACELLEGAGHADRARQLHDEIVGLDVIGDKWTFELVEDFDRNYYAAVRDAVQQLRDELVEGRWHLYEAELKVRRQVRPPDA